MIAIRGAGIDQCRQLTALGEALQRSSARSMYPEADEREVFLRVIVVDLTLDRVPDFCEAFGVGWYADRNVIARAVSAGRFFSLIHIARAATF
jgi:hypothetical protein